MNEVVERVTIGLPDGSSYEFDGVLVGIDHAMLTNAPSPQVVQALKGLELTTIQWDNGSADVAMIYGWSEAGYRQRQLRLDAKRAPLVAFGIKHGWLKRDEQLKNMDHDRAKQMFEMVRAHLKGLPAPKYYCEHVKSSGGLRCDSCGTSVREVQRMEREGLVDKFWTLQE